MDKSKLKIQQNEIIPEDYSNFFFSEMFKNLRRDLELLCRQLRAVDQTDHSIDDNDFDTSIDVTTGASNRTITLPTAAKSPNREISFLKVDAGAGNVVVGGNGSETINGAANYSLTAQYESVTLRCNGEEWFIKV